MQKLAGIITEGQFKEKINEAEADLLTPNGLHTFLHNLRNLINGGNKNKQLDMVNNAISSIADKLTEIIGDIDDTPHPDGDFDPMDYADDYTPPAYEAINDLMDYIRQGTGARGQIKPYRSISWLPGVSAEDGDMDMLTYKKGKQEIAIGADDVYQDPSDENFNAWVISSNDPSLDFGEYLTFNEVVDAVSNWLES